MLRATVSDRLRKGHELLVRQTQDVRQLRIVNSSPKRRSKSFRGVAYNPASTDAEVTLLGRDIRHTLAMGNIDQVERCRARLSAAPNGALLSFRAAQLALANGGSGSLLTFRARSSHFRCAAGFPWLTIKESLSVS